MRRIFHLFSKENSIRGASVILVVTLTLSNVLGMLRDHFLTRNVDTYHLDIYNAAFRIPDLIFNFLILGAISSAFIPVFSGFLAKKKNEEAFLVANILLNLALIGTVVSSVIFYFLMPKAMVLIVPGFDSYRFDEAVKYARLLMLTPIFFSFSYVMGGILNSFNRFFYYSLAPLIYNLSIIIGSLFLAPRYGLGGVILCVIIGSFLHFLVQFPAAFSLGYRYRFAASLTNESVRKVIKLMVPRTIGMGASQVLLIAYTAIASGLVAGSISAFVYAQNIETMPVVVLGTSFATAIFPTLSAKIAEGNEEHFSFYLDRAIRTIGYLLIPATVFFILLRAQIVRLILGSGKFGWDDTKMTAITMGVFSLSLVAQGLVPILSKAFYAIKDTKTPMWVSVATVFISILLAYPLSRSLGVAGLALSYSIGSYFNAIVLFYYLKKSYPSILGRQLMFSYFKTFCFSLVAGFLVWSSMHLFANFVDMNRFWGVLTQTTGASLVGIAGFLGLSYLFDQEELGWAITRKINGKEKQ